MSDDAPGAARGRLELPVVALLATFTVAMAFTTPTVVRVAGAVGVIAMAGAGLDRDPAVLRGRVIAAVGLTVLTVADRPASSHSSGDVRDRPRFGDSAPPSHAMNPRDGVVSRHRER